jgi:hypothetical protein
MNTDDKLIGVAWKFKKPPTLEEYKAFMSKEPKLAMIFEDGHREELPLEVIPHSPFPDDDFYVLPFLIKLGDVKGWETPEEVGTLRLSIQGKGLFWLSREAFSVTDREPTKT